MRNKDHSYDVVVVGGGPSGSSAALHLTRLGHRVVLIDKAIFPRDKCCGDGLTTSALRHLAELGLDPSRIPSWRVVNKTTWRSPSGHSIDLEVPSAEDVGMRIAVARRFELDAELLSLTRAAGVEVFENCAMTAIQVDSSGVHVETSDDRTFSTQYAVAADGMWSPTRRALTTTDSPHQPYLGEIHAFRQYFTNVTGPAKDRLWVSFEPDLLPGYVWSFPVGDNCVNIGFGIERQPGKSVQWMKDVWPDILQRPHVKKVLGPNAVAESVHKAWPIPAHIDLDLLTTAGGRVLFVGDAARVVDPLTGEGIGQALETGALAASAISDSFTRPSAVADQYRKALRFGMKIDNAFARTLANLVRHEKGARAVIRLAPAGPWKGQYALRWVFEDNPRAGLLTPWRWRKRFSKKAGAFQ